MGNTKNNEQFKKTETKMINSALLLMEQMPFEKVSVSKICESAKVNRSTFYAHFIDIYDMLDKIDILLREELDAIYREKSTIMTGVVPFSSDSLHIFIGYIHTHQTFYRILLSNTHSLPDNLLLPYGDRLIPFISDKQDTVDKDELLYYLSGFQGSLYTIIRKWLENDCREPEEHIARIIANCVPDMLRQIPLHIFCDK